jgi:hypothetical protein
VHRPEGRESLRELRLAVRTLARSPGFAALAIGMLGLTTGLNAVVFSLVNALLLRPLPVTAPQELLRIYSRTPGELMSHGPMASADWAAVRRECRSLEAVAASFLTTGALDDGSSGRLVVAEVVSADHFETLCPCPRSRHWSSPPRRRSRRRAPPCSSACDEASSGALPAGADCGRGW